MIFTADDGASEIDFVREVVAGFLLFYKQNGAFGIRLIINSLKTK